jgi:glutamine amidotransferase
MITIVDYQMGNLRSVQKGFQRVGHEAQISSDPEVIRQAEKLVLPGVGAFGDAMAELEQRHLIEPIKEAILGGKRFLGICLGLQLLFEQGYEGGLQPGLGILPGEVVRFDLPRQFKVPHMGWNVARIVRRPPVLAQIPDLTYFYFVHSFYVVPAQSEVIATETDYHVPFCSMIWRDNIVATQFHPEKSQQDGLELLRAFGDW